MAPCTARLQKEHQLKIIKCRNKVSTYPHGVMYGKTAERTSNKLIKRRNNISTYTHGDMYRNTAESTST
jgi:hypothetical protein